MVRPRLILVKAGFHTCVSRTNNGARCLMIYGHWCSQAIPAFVTKACMLATKSHMLISSEACAAICWDCDLWTQKYFLPFKKKAKLKTKNINTTFGKSLFLTQYWMRYAIYIPPNTKDLAINITMVAYGNRQNAITVARCEHWNQQVSF